jgi:uncharacterized membrane protein YpjA
MQVIVLLLLGYYVIHRTKIDSIARKYSKLIVACLMLGIVFGVFWYMSGETYTIRFVSAMATISKMNFHNFLIGDGFGTYAQAGLSESYIFHVMYETGILGIACLFIVLFVLMKEQLKEKNYIAVFVLCFYVISSLINEGYMIPFIICIPVLCCLSMQSSIEDGGFVKESV